MFCCGIFRACLLPFSLPVFLFFIFNPWSPAQEASQGDLREEEEMKQWKVRNSCGCAVQRCESPGGAGEQPVKAGAAGLPGELCLATGNGHGLREYQLHSLQV